MSDVVVNTIKLGSRYQIVIPAEIRKSMGLSERDELLVAKSGNAIVIIPKPKSYADHLMGLHKNVWQGVEPDAYVREERDSWGD
ncbi:AbrB/MazE/SpoVT family DNA-binding domain-containing protein [Candidatus Sordicultor fermentans]|jgi:AbrB family looped-hinge helix DNA binding protein|uniref:AbrB/MazE/SpoVT family DNA-binding domain-containing protein n=1 Tax=Candidatus Sordicultor fermentans TaxID=1953203 RepID=UPI001696D827|nr:AbrB/MazE/SpoVT family DNA-binding domain-containing protein [Atribacterota bacterium]NLY04563.1 AbrB/MazE/SpoVT family DNA-binding domain-containing protein [Candidatus Atribacteria bacterium]